MTLQTANVTVDLTDARHREVLLVFVHDLHQPPDADNHPTAYLHWASRVAFYKNELSHAKRDGRNAQSLKLTKVKSDAEKKKGALHSQYEQNRMAYRDAFVGRAETAQPQFDQLVRCPSNRDEVQFYSGPVLQAVQRRNPGALDLSDCFSTDPMFKAGAVTTVQQAFEKIAFDYSGRLEACASVLLIDEVWAKGITTGAVLSHLSRSGLQRQARVTIFVPLRIRQPQFLDGCAY